MAATPLYVASLDALKSQLRLSGVPDDAADTLAILDQSVVRARLSFIRRLGLDRVNEITSIIYTATPATEDEVLRALANEVEVKLVTVDLMRRLPASWQDASGDQQRRWNEEAPFRERGETELGKEASRLLAEIEEDFQLLAEEEEIADESDFRVFNGTPDEAPPRPGDSMRPFPFSRNGGVG